MLVKRSISAVIILVISFALIFAGGWIFSTGIAAILSIAIWEFFGLFKKGGYQPNSLLLIFGTIGIIFATSTGDPFITTLAYFLTVIFILISAIIRYRGKEQTAAVDLAIELAALLFITFLGSYLIKIRILPNGLFWIIISVIPTGIGDVGAYLVGSLIGKTKIAPAISPNKSVEGFIGGVVVASFIGYGIGYVANQFVPEITITASTIIGCINGLLSPLGDLSKSIIKRQFNQKNTSNLIPGHGGLLDRLDTSLWAGPIAFYIITYFFL